MLRSFVCCLAAKGILISCSPDLLCLTLLPALCIVQWPCRCTYPHVHPLTTELNCTKHMQLIEQKKLNGPIETAIKASRFSFWKEYFFLLFFQYCIFFPSNLCLSSPCLLLHPIGVYHLTNHSGSSNVPTVLMVIEGSQKHKFFTVVAGDTWWI